LNFYSIVANNDVYSLFDCYQELDSHPLIATIYRYIHRNNIRDSNYNSGTTTINAFT